MLEWLAYAFLSHSPLAHCREESRVQDLKSLLIENLPHLERYALHLTRNRTEAEDLVQDCAERALLKGDLFEAGSNFRAWLFTIMHNLFLNKARRNRVAAQYLADAKPRLGRVMPPPQPAAIMLSRTLDALAKLSQEERDAIILLGADQLTYREVASQSGVPVGTMKSRVGRGRARLRRSVMGADAGDAVEL
jgi:RNA polymerase sigma-70 factor (ECF subfamily)